MTGASPTLAEPKSGTPSEGQASGSRWLPDTGTRPRPRVLIVDDEEDTREMYAWCMRAAGWIVEGVANGEAALLVAPTFGPDIIVMDLYLPSLGGIEATRRLKADAATRDTPIVACSGVDRRRVETLALLVGCEEFVAKPCLPERLRAVLERVLSRRSGSPR
jgi:two-component system cell cycle response regulator DivK